MGRLVIEINDRGSVLREDVNSDDVVDEREVMDSRVVIETEGFDWAEGGDTEQALLDGKGMKVMPKRTETWGTTSRRVRGIGHGTR